MKKSTKKRLAGVIFTGLMMVSGGAQAQNNTEKTPSLPSTSTGNKPLPAWLQYKSPYVGKENDISNPHRTVGEIETWAQRATANVLTFNKRNYMTKMGSFKKYFQPSGWKQYTDYLKSSHIVEMVGANNYSVGAIVDERPLVINQGDVSGAYNWILRMPVTISFFTKDASSGKQKTGPSGKFYLFLDIARVSSGGGEDGIAITNWRMENNSGSGN